MNKKNLVRLCIVLIVIFIVYVNTQKSKASFSVVDCTNVTDLTTLGGGVTPIPQAECEALEDLYTSTNGSSWTNHTNWDTATDVGTWRGVTRTGAHVTKISLKTNNLVGTIPASISDLTYLEDLRLTSNSLSGSIPDISALTNLLYLYLDDNQLTGSIPSLSSNTALQYILLGENQLTGSIPSLSNNTALYLLDFSRNQLTGSLPSLTNNTALFDFSVESNKLSGTIPSLSANTSLAAFNVSYNNFSGEIPDISGSSITVCSFKENSLYTSSNSVDLDIDTRCSENWSSTQTIAPTGLTATRNGNNVVITWNPIEYTSIGSYNIYSSDVPGGPYTNLEATIARNAGSTVTITAPNTNKYYIVQAYTPTHASGLSSSSQQTNLSVNSSEVAFIARTGGGGGGMLAEIANKINNALANSTKPKVLDDKKISPTPNAGCPAKYPAFTYLDLFKPWPTKNIQWLLNEEVNARIRIDGHGGVKTRNGIILYKKKYQSEIGLNDDQIKSSFIDSKTLAHINAKLCAK